MIWCKFNRETWTLHKMYIWMGWTWDVSDLRWRKAKGEQASPTRPHVPASTFLAIPPERNISTRMIGWIKTRLRIGSAPLSAVYRSVMRRPNNSGTWRSEYPNKSIPRPSPVHPFNSITHLLRPILLKISNAASLDDMYGCYSCQKKSCCYVQQSQQRLVAAQKILLLVEKEHPKFHP